MYNIPSSFTQYPPGPPVIPLVDFEGQIVAVKPIDIPIAVVPCTEMVMGQMAKNNKETLCH
jgi:hypothetical protein